MKRAKSASLRQYRGKGQWYVKVWHSEIRKHFEVPTKKYTKEDASKFLRSWLKNYDQWHEEQLDDANPTYVENAFKLFLDHKRGDGQTSKRTIIGYELALNGLLEFCSSKLSVKKLGSTDKANTPLYDYSRHLLTMVTETTVYVRLRAVKACLKWLERQEIIDKVGYIEIKNSKVNDKLTDSEYNGLMQFVDDPIIGTWIRFARYTGYRLSEIPKVYLSEDGYYKAVGKRGKERSFNLSPELVAMLHEIQATDYDPSRVTKAFTLAYRKYLLSMNPDYLPVGGGVDDIPMIGKQKVYRLVKTLLIDRYCKQHGVSHDELNQGQIRTAMRLKTFHSLRHTFCSEIHILAGGDFAKTKEFMGHSSSSTTERYTHLDTVESTEEFSKLMMARAEA